MDFASSTRAAEDRTRWKGIVIKSSVVPQRPHNVMGYNRLDSDNVVRINFQHSRIRIRNGLKPI